MPPTLIDALRGMSQWEAQDVLRHAAMEALWRPLLEALPPEQAAAVENAVYETARLAWQQGLAAGVKLAQNRHAPAQLAAAAEALVKEKRTSLPFAQR